MMLLVALLALTETPPCGPAAVVSYAEEAPSDFVIVRNASPAGWEIERLVWRIGDAAAGLVFDALPGGVGAGSSQRFRALDGRVVLAAPPSLDDGGTELGIGFAGFPPEALFRFAIDLDDRAGAGTTLAPGALEGAEVEAGFVHETGIRLTLNGRFGADDVVRLETACTS